MEINFIISIVLMVVTGLLDGVAFSRAAIVGRESGITLFWGIVKTMAIFNVGLLTYIAANFFLNKQGIDNAVIITLLYFVIAIISVAVVSGNFFSLPSLDKVIALAAVVLVGLLYLRGVSD